MNMQTVREVSIGDSNLFFGALRDPWTDVPPTC